MEIETLAVAWSGPDLGDKLQFEKVLAAVRSLKPEYQDVIMLRFVEDLSLKETAASMNKTEGAVKLMQHRAIEELKKKLGERTMMS